MQDVGYGLGHGAFCHTYSAFPKALGHNIEVISSKPFNALGTYWEGVYRYDEPLWKIQDPHSECTKFS